jgi:hypothetical protein
MIVENLMKYKIHGTSHTIEARLRKTTTPNSSKGKRHSNVQYIKLNLGDNPL